jgi:hypothetical protein
MFIKNRFMYFFIIFLKQLVARKLKKKRKRIVLMN